jgi:hypothetical protein
VLWKREYGYKTRSGRISNVRAYPDGSFVFSVQTYPFYTEGGQVLEKSIIIKCASDGNELWKREFDDYSGNLLNNLFLTEDGQIITSGMQRGKDDDHTDIMLMKLYMDGRILAQKSFGGSDFEHLSKALYDRELGIVISGSTQSRDGDFAMKGNTNSISFIARIDKEFNLKWVSPAGDGENFEYNQLDIWDGFVYVPGGITAGKGGYHTGFVMKLDSDGKRVWTRKVSGTDTGMYELSVLSDGSIAVGMGVGQHNEGAIVVLDGGGNEKKRLKELKFRPGHIVSTADGGFIAYAVREIKCIPQPPYISSIWFDTESVAVKYNKNLEMEWRKTYDKYQDEMKQDFLLPLEDGRIIAEGDKK